MQKPTPFFRNPFAVHTAALVLIVALATSRGETMDRARLETRVDEARQTFGVTGRGVLVAIMDRGIDWKNADFRNADGSTRIASLLDLTDDAGAAANPYGAGTLYTREQIDQALTSGGTLRTRDAVGDGTALAGIAAGSGRNSAGGRYAGVAPDATFLIVKLLTQGAPAHDGESAESPYWDAARVPIAFQFVRDKAAELGMPCVMLPNFSSIGGPTDGTGASSRLIDATVGPGIPGLVVVQPAGNDGNRANRVFDGVSPGGRKQIGVIKESTGPIYLDFWYGGQDRFDVIVHTPVGASGVLASPDTNSAFTNVRTSVFDYWHHGSDADSYEALNGKRLIWIRLDGPPGAYAVELVGRVVSGGGSFHGSLSGSSSGPTLPPRDRFTSSVSHGSIADLASARHAIVATSHVVRNTWTDIDGIVRSIDGEGEVGDLWLGSSTGPTLDGRRGITVSAPADSVFTTLNPRSWLATSRFNLIQDGSGLYGRFSNTGAAGAIVGGIVALMLEANPALSAVDVKTILESTARLDAFTGPAPGVRFGSGKVDAFAAVQEARRRVSEGPPQAPRGLTATVTGNHVSFAWSAPGIGPAPTGYVLEAGTTSGATHVTLPVGPATAFEVDAPSGTYYVRVRATNHVGPGPASREIGVTLGPVVPGAPANLRAAVDAARVSLEWSAPAAGGAVEAYLLEAGSGPGLANIVRAPVGTAQSFAAADVPAGRYYVRVRAANRWGTGPASNEVLVAIGAPDPPTLLPAEVAGSTVTLSWTPAPSGVAAASFLVVARSTPTGPIVASVPAAGTSLVVPGVPRGTYFVSVAGFAGSVQGVESNQIVVTLP